MLVSLLIDAALLPVKALLQLIALPVVSDLVIPEDVYTTVDNVFSAVGYFLPMPFLLGILLFDVALDNFHILWALADKIKGFVK